MPPSKEQEVLDRQRRLAANLKAQKLKQQKAAAAAKNKPKTGSTSKSTSSTAAKAKPKATLKRPAVKSASASASTSTKPTTASTTTTHKRPGSSRTARDTAPPNKRPASVSAVLAAARVKAARSTTATGAASTTEETIDLTSDTNTTNNATETTTSKLPSPQLTRKVKTTKAPGAFSSLVNSAKVASAKGTVQEDYASTSLPSMEPDDFWKHLRDWDFCQQVHQQLEQQKQPNKNLSTNKNKDDNNSAPTTKTIPEIFLNARHYVAAWAPLCLAECRAQILSEWLNDIGSGRIQRGGVQVNAQMTDNRGPSFRNKQKDQYMVNMSRLEPDDSVCLKLFCHQRTDKDMSFVTNDIVLLVPLQHKDLVIGVLNGTYKPTGEDAPFRKWGVLVGHSKCTRKTPHELIVEVSKRKWAMVPTVSSAGVKRGEEAKLWLWKLGSNVTALREFTALCRMDQLPLKRFLLGQHLDQHHHGTHTHDKGKKHPEQAMIPSTSNKADLLEKMGGSQALGKGFMTYAHKKFNPSQLMAIAASAHEYGEGGFTLIKGPPGTGKTTTLCAVLNSLHIRQFNKYYDQVRNIAKEKKNRQFALELARKSKPRLLVCAPSNAAVDNIILKIMEDGFVDGQGKRYNPSMIRIGVGQSGAIRRAISLENKVDAIFTEYQDLGALENTIKKHKTDLQHLNMEITKCRRRIHAIEDASPWPLSKDWEIRVDEVNFDQPLDQGGGRVYFCNHIEKKTTFEVPPPPEPGEKQFRPTAMPEYRALMSNIVKLVEQCFTIKTQLERCTIVKGSIDSGANHMQIRMALELHVLNSVHMIFTTLGTAGGRTLEGVDKFEVVVVDEAAQSVEPATLSALQLGSRHCVLVGDPQQLPATIFNVSGKTTKYDRSLFQRLEEAKQPVYMLDEQYRMHPQISHFPRHIFYGGNLLDGPNVTNEGYGNPLRQLLAPKVPLLQPFTVLDLDSKEERGGTSLANSSEAHLAVHLYNSLCELSGGVLKQSRVAIITPYSQQTKLLKRTFENALGPRYEDLVEINSVDAFQGREANVVIFSAVRAAGSHGIGFLSDVRRMNVALTRAKHFLFVIARCRSIVVNPYWKDLVQHARENHAVLRVPIHKQGNRNRPPVFGNVPDWQLEDAAGRPYSNRMDQPGDGPGNNFNAALADLAALAGDSGKPSDPRRNNQNNNGKGNNRNNNNNNSKKNQNSNRKQNGDPRSNNQNQKNNQQQSMNQQGGRDPRQNPNGLMSGTMSVPMSDGNTMNAYQPMPTDPPMPDGNFTNAYQPMPNQNGPMGGPGMDAGYQQPMQMNYSGNNNGQGYITQGIPPPPPRPPPPPPPPRNGRGYNMQSLPPPPPPGGNGRGYNLPNIPPPPPRAQQQQNIPPPPPPPPPRQSKPRNDPRKRRSN